MSNRDLQQDRYLWKTRLSQQVAYPLHEPFITFWPSVVLGISLGGACWPFTLYLVGLFEDGGASALFSVSRIEMLMAAGIMLFVGGTVCLMVTALVAAGIVLAMNLILTTLRIDHEHLLVGTFTGGLVGLTLALPFCMTDGSLDSQGSFKLGIAFMIGFATVLTQLGGTLGAWRSLRKRETLDVKTHLLAGNLQFGIKQMFYVTAWCAGILTMLKLLGVLHERLLGLIGIWFVLQLVSLLVIGLATNRLLATQAKPEQPSA